MLDTKIAPYDLHQVLLDRGHNEVEILKMTGPRAFREFCEWHGLIDWGQTLWTLALHLQAQEAALTGASLVAHDGRRRPSSPDADPLVTADGLTTEQFCAVARLAGDCEVSARQEPHTRLWTATLRFRARADRDRFEEAVRAHSP